MTETRRLHWPFGALIGITLIGFLLIASPADACSITGDPAAGKVVYEQTCIACHGDSGKSPIPGLPNLAKKNGPLAQSASLLASRIAQGFESGKAPMAMPPKGGNPDLTSSDIENVLDYMRKQFNIC